MEAGREVTEDWKENWERYLRKKFGDTVPDGKLAVDLGEIDFRIPPLLGATAESMRAIQKHNARQGVFNA